jgi:hypothetical protein
MLEMASKRLNHSQLEGASAKKKEHMSWFDTLHALLVSDNRFGLPILRLDMVQRLQLLHTKNVYICLTPTIRRKGPSRI